EETPTQFHSRSGPRGRQLSYAVRVGGSSSRSRWSRLHLWSIRTTWYFVSLMTIFREIELMFARQGRPGKRSGIAAKPLMADSRSELILRAGFGSRPHRTRGQWVAIC